MKNNNHSFVLAVLLILAAAALRVINAEMHLYALAPIAALGIFAGATIRNRSNAFIITLAAQFLSDCYFQFFTNTPGFYGISQLFTYGAMALVTFIGMQMQTRKALSILGYTLSGSLVFFILSNFGVWVNECFANPATRMYSSDLNGLTQTFLMALPFYTPTGTSLFFNALVSDMFCSGVLFGAFALLQKKASAKSI